MSIIKTITNDYEFAEWCKQSDSYKNNFSFDGANALQAYLEELSEEMGDNIEFDPIAWCCEFSEYASYDEFQHDTGYIKDGVQYNGYDNINSLDELKDNTTVIEFDGGIIVSEF